MIRVRLFEDNKIIIPGSLVLRPKCSSSPQIKYGSLSEFSPIRLVGKSLEWWLFILSSTLPYKLRDPCWVGFARQTNYNCMSLSYRIRCIFVFTSLPFFTVKQNSRFCIPLAIYPPLKESILSKEFRNDISQ